MSELDSNVNISMTQEQYACEWKIDAEHISKDGHYTWMAERLGPQDLVIEIGCGSGASTLALAKKSRVICIESNLNLVEFCKNKLQANNISVQVVEFSELEKASSQVAIVSCDVFDNAIEQYLRAMNPTAVVCWLIGSTPEHIAKNLNKSLASFAGEEMSIYRNRVHKRAYELGSNVLELNGVVHIVERVGIRSWSEKDYIRHLIAEIQSELANAGYLVDKANAYLRRTPNGVNKSSIKMMAVDRFNDSIEALSSMKSIRI